MKKFQALGDGDDKLYIEKQVTSPETEVRKIVQPCCRGGWERSVGLTDQGTMRRGSEIGRLSLQVHRSRVIRKKENSCRRRLRVKAVNWIGGALADCFWEMYGEGARGETAVGRGRRRGEECGPPMT
jgi:hypothetical protein